MACEKEIKEELNIIIDKYGLFIDKHQFYAVVAEELDEIYDEIQEINNSQLTIWNKVKKDINFESDVKNLDKTIDNLIKEAIQVKAIIQKLEKSVINFGKDDNNGEIEDNSKILP
jgi:septal ring factor EnvC (AmiA/AmiB activator)